MDWSIPICSIAFAVFKNFKAMFDLAQEGHDEGPIANLGLISQYLERFVEQYYPMVTANILIDGSFKRFSSAHTSSPFPSRRIRI